MMLRSFLPVGQGAFYCEQFSHRLDREKVNIIYDCGSSPNVKVVESQIQNNFKEGEVIHALFISHLDDDHTNGIPFLLEHYKVKNMFFPLVTGTDKMYLYMQHIVDGGSRDSFVVRFLENPRLAFERLNIEYTPMLYPVVTGQGDIPQMDREMDAEPVYPGTNVASIIFGNPLEAYKMYPRWCYIPYNFRQPERLQKLQDELNMRFGDDIGNEELRRKWENGSYVDRRNIKEAYKEVKGSLNINSMTLYSGLEEDYECRQYIVTNRCPCKCSCDWKAAGCLYMGDYDASGVKKWNDLQNAYEDYWQQIGCVQVPHHGSRHNYNTELAELNAYYVISAGTSNSYRHPHSMVVKDLLFHGQHPYIVTENQGSALQLLVEL